MESAPAVCDVCGDTLPEGAYFCGECGASVPEFGAPISNSARRAASPTPPVTRVPETNVPAGESAAKPAVVAAAIDPLPSEPVPGEPASEASVSSPPSVEATPVATAQSYTLVFSTGERAHIVGRGLIGRMPVAPANEPFDHLIVVSDPSKTVSKTHLRVEARPEGLMVTDLDSANGTVVSMPGIAAERLAPHERVILLSGATVGIGDQSFTIQ